MTNPASTTLPPWLSTRQAADIIGMDADFVRGEVLDGRLRAIIIQRPGKRRVFRIRAADFSIYMLKYWRHAGVRT